MNLIHITCSYYIYFYSLYSKIIVPSHTHDESVSRVFMYVSVSPMSVSTELTHLILVPESVKPKCE